MRWAKRESCYRGPCARIGNPPVRRRIQGPGEQGCGRLPEGVRLYTGSIFSARRAAFRISHSQKTGPVPLRWVHPAPRFCTHSFFPSNDPFQRGDRSHRCDPESCVAARAPKSSSVADKTVAQLQSAATPTFLSQPGNHSILILRRGCRCPTHPAAPPSSATAQRLLPPASPHPGNHRPRTGSARARAPGTKCCSASSSSFTPSSAVWLAQWAAGYEHLTNVDKAPTTATDRGAFGQLRGAGALRAITEDAFSESVFAPIFHEDPRYYRMGNPAQSGGANPLRRAPALNDQTDVVRTIDQLRPPRRKLFAGSGTHPRLPARAEPKPEQNPRNFRRSHLRWALGYVFDELFGIWPTSSTG